MTSDGEETKKLYYEDSHRKEFKATVLSCEERLTAKGKKDGYAVVLDQTAFFPEGGGQFGDRGLIDDVEVYDTHEKGGIILHYTKMPVEVGTTVTGKLDFAERFSRMQEHSGEHIVSGIVHRLHGYDNVGFHLGSENTTLDFNGELSEEQLLEVERLANEAVFADLPVQISYPSREELKILDYRSKIEIEGQVRLVEIPGVDICACCAPHVAHTGEIGMIKFIACDRHFPDPEHSGHAQKQHHSRCQRRPCYDPSFIMLQSVCFLLLFTSSLPQLRVFLNPPVYLHIPGAHIPCLRSCFFPLQPPLP